MFVLECIWSCCYKSKKRVDQDDEDEEEKREEYWSSHGPVFLGEEVQTQLLEDRVGENSPDQVDQETEVGEQEQEEKQATYTLKGRDCQPDPISDFSVTIGNENFVE